MGRSNPEKNKCFLIETKKLLQMGSSRSISRLSIVISLHVVVVVLTSLSQFHSIYSIPVDARCEYGGGGVGVLLWFTIVVICVCYCLHWQRSNGKGRRVTTIDWMLKKWKFVADVANEEQISNISVGEHLCRAMTASALRQWLVTQDEYWGYWAIKLCWSQLTSWTQW